MVGLARGEEFEPYNPGHRKWLTAIRFVHGLFYFSAFLSVAIIVICGVFYLGVHFNTDGFQETVCQVQWIEVDNETCQDSNLKSHSYTGIAMFNFQADYGKYNLNVNIPLIASCADSRKEAYVLVNNSYPTGFVLPCYFKFIKHDLIFSWSAIDQASEDRLFWIIIISAIVGLSLITIFAAIWRCLVYYARLH